MQNDSLYLRRGGGGLSGRDRAFAGTPLRYDTRGPEGARLSGVVQQGPDIRRSESMEKSTREPPVQVSNNKCLQAARHFKLFKDHRAGACNSQDGIGRRPDNEANDAARGNAGSLFVGRFSAVQRTLGRSFPGEATLPFSFWQTFW